MTNILNDNLNIKLQKAYILLKKSFYYENNSLLHIKYQLTKFEAENNLLNKISRNDFFNELANNLFDENFIQNLLNKINYKKIIKKFDEKEQKVKYNYIIDCPIELHLISLLWILDSGVELDNNIGKHSYGYRLEENIDKSIFKRYIKQYHEWLENGLKIAEELVERDENIVLLKIDLKRFYYNIDKKKLLKEIDEKLLKDDLFQIILKINDRYTNLLKSKLSEEDNKDFGEYFLPIGLYSSAILSNIYLKEFDKKILDYYPDYYGRYVDDLFIVIRERNIPTLTDLNKYLKERFPNVFDEKNLKSLNLINSFDFKNTDKMTMKVISGNLKKIKLKESKETFLKKPSPFAYLPNEKEIHNLYKEIAISETKDIRERKFNISVYLSKNLNIFYNVPKKEIEDKLKDIIDFFHDENIIKYYIYFDKIFTTILLTENISLFDTIFNQIKEALNNYKINDSDVKEHFFYSLKFAISLNPKFIEKNQKYFMYNFFINNKSEYDKLMLDVLDIINSNMFQGNKIVFSLLNYINFDKTKLTKINFLENSYFNLKFFKEEDLELDNEKLILSPRFIHFNEIGLFLFRKEIINVLKEKETKNIFDKNIEYFKLNFLENKLEKKINKEIFKGLISFYKINKNLELIKFYEEKRKNNFRIGVVSFNIKEKELLDNLNGHPNISIEKKERLYKILNEAKENKVDILVLSETSIPIQWLNFISKFARENQMIITGGLDHIFLNDDIKNVGNFLFTIIPFATKKYKTSFIKFRLKNFYAPGEIKQITGRNFHIPHLKEKKYDIFSWKGLYFSNFNCFELADIESRGLVKNYIDLLICSVFNKDTYYFNNILESSCRDLHVYLAQSNTSIYGECKILQPSQKNLMIKACISGGMSDNLLVEEINIETLRNFQSLNYILQEENHNFKLTPPNLDIEAIKARKENKLEKYLQKKFPKFEKKDKELLDYLIKNLSEEALNDIFKLDLTSDKKEKLKQIILNQH